MNESLLESANLYVLGLLTEPGQVAFERELCRNAALQKEVHRLQEAVLALAASAPQVAPPADLRAQLLAKFPAASSPATAQPIQQAQAQPRAASPARPSLKILHVVPWAAAAAMAVVFYQKQEAIHTAEIQTAAAQAESAKARERELNYQEAVHLSETARAQSETAQAGLRTKLAEAEAALSALSTEKETLLAELTVLRDDRKLDKTRIAVLGSLLKDQPTAVAVSLWRQEQQDGLLVVENLPALPAGKDYQLWVIDPNLKTPVSAGVFKVDVTGKVRIEFKPDHAVQSAYKFAVTREKEGGATVPTMDQMIVIGG